MGLINVCYLPLLYFVVLKLFPDMAPEVLEQQPFAPPGDVYGFAMTLFEMATGRGVWPGLSCTIVLLTFLPLGALLIFPSSPT